MIFRWTGREMPYAHMLDFYLVDKVFDISRARNELGYAPQISMEEGVRRTAAWYRAQGWL